MPKPKSLTASPEDIKKLEEGVEKFRKFHETMMLSKRYEDTRENKSALHIPDPTIILEEDRIYRKEFHELTEDHELRWGSVLSGHHLINADDACVCHADISQLAFEMDLWEEEFWYEFNEFKYSTMCMSLVGVKALRAFKARRKGE